MSFKVTFNNEEKIYEKPVTVLDIVGNDKSIAPVILLRININIVFKVFLNSFKILAIQGNILSEIKHINSFGSVFVCVLYTENIVSVLILLTVSHIDFNMETSFVHNIIAKEW